MKMGGKKTIMVLPFIVIILMGTISCSNDQFALSEENFIPKIKEECITDVKISMKDGKYISSGMHDIKGFYCHKGKYTLIGKVIIEGFIFESQEEDPLKFVVDKDKGFVYGAGRGTVTKPDGKIIKLPVKRWIFF